ncbi:hypothetical protein HHS_06020 [Candidatus Pantoea carbekii]|uniref:Uncharacterized protein n=1 Tax=Candidatus Pantoea carbekii TaxID=1235990 RepID=U3U7Z0_9GAMM|nr:hypothetical protein HHS_06020 [Candidatus Pantoea carbekii]
MGTVVHKRNHANILVVVLRITDKNSKITMTTVQTILDKLMSGCIPLLLTFSCMWLLLHRIDSILIIKSFLLLVF